jgi:hypothetical protein
MQESRMVIGLLSRISSSGYINHELSFTTGVAKLNHEEMDAWAWGEKIIDTIFSTHRVMLGCLLFGTFYAS